MPGTTLLRVPVDELRRLMEISTELSDALLTAFDARRQMLAGMGEGGLVLAGDDGPDLHRLQEFRAGSVKRVASAVGEGSVAISAVHSFLSGARP